MRSRYSFWKVSALVANLISPLISSLLGQISPSHTGFPSLPIPRGSVIRSLSIVPAIAYDTTNGGEARKFAWIFQDFISDVIPNRGIFEKAFRLPLKSIHPCLLLECGFMNNLEDVEYLRTESGIEKLAKDQNLPLLFDSVEASYADHNGNPIGSFGNAECFSVHASKFLNGFEGGYITTNNDDLACKLRTVLNNGLNENGIISESLQQGAYHFLQSEGIGTPINLTYLKEIL